MLCVNVVIHPRRRNRISTFTRALDLLRPGGRLIMVVPSIESECLLAEATGGGGSGRNCVQVPRGAKPVPLGVLSVVGVPTKHFAAAELQVVAATLGLERVEISRVEYVVVQLRAQAGPARRDCARGTGCSRRIRSRRAAAPDRGRAAR